MKDRVKKILNPIYNDTYSIVKSYPFACVTVAIGMLIILFAFEYKDGLSLTAWSVEVWDAIVEGPFHDYSANVRGAWHGPMNARSILPLLPWSIWNLPLWLTHPLTSNTNVLSTACIFWSKLGLVVCFFVAGLMCYKIASQISEEKGSGCIAAILFWGSGTIGISVGIFMQDEILYILAFLCAFNDVLKKKSYQSLVWMAIAVSLMPAMILPSLLLILYTFKKFFLRVISLVIICAPYVLNQVFVPIWPGFPNSSDDYLAWFFKSSTLIGKYSTFAVIICVLLAWQFFNEYETEEERKEFLLYHITCLMVAMCLLSWSHPYRYCLCVPFLAINIASVSDPQKRIAGVAGICVFEYCRFICSCFENYWFWPFDLSALAQKILQIEPYRDITMYSLLTEYFPFLSGKEYLVLAITCACGSWLIWLTHPRNKQKMRCNFPLQIIMNIYSSCAILFTLLFFLLLYKTDIIKVNIDDRDSLAPAITGMEGLNEYYYAKDSASKVSLTIRPVTWLCDYPDDQMLYIDVVDVDNGEIIGTAKTYADELPDNQYFQMEITNVSIKKDHWYIFRLYSPETISDSEHYMYLLHTDPGTANSGKHYAAIWKKNNDEFNYIATDYDVFSEIVAY